MSRLFGQLLESLNTIASIGIMLLMVLICCDVAGRALFNQPLPGVPEIVKFSIIAMFWLQCAHTLRKRKHLRTALLLGMMPRPMQTTILILNAATGIFLFGFIAWLAWGETVKVWEIGAFEGEHPMRIPIWPFWGTLVLGSVLTALQFLADIVRYLNEGPAANEVAEIVEINDPAITS